MPYNFSYSSLYTLDKCKRCFWLQHNGKVKFPREMFPSLPSGMDQRFKEYFDLYRGTEQLPPVLEGKVAPGTRLYDNRVNLEKWINFSDGLRWKDPKGNLLVGAVDDLLIHNDEIIVLDHKTRGYDFRKNTLHDYKQSYVMQLEIYNFLLNQNGHSTKDHGHLLVWRPEYVQDEALVKFETTLLTIQADPKNTLQTLELALEILSEKIPKANERCKPCEFVAKASKF